MTQPPDPCWTATIVIGIPTFRRPRQLAALLDSLVSQLPRLDAAVLVADNDCGVDAAAVVEAWSSRWPAAACVPVRTPGISAVRNALVEHANAMAPGWRWLIMLDDDGMVAPGWGDAIAAAQKQLDAHVVAGPVLGGDLPPGASRLARNSLFARRRRWKTGPVEMLNGAQNICISRELGDLLPQPWFREELGTSGGEDYAFFRSVRAAGGRLAWCDEAVVMEPPTAAQLTWRGLFFRYGSTGTYMAHIDRRFDGFGPVAWLAIKHVIKPPVRAAWSLCTGNLNRAAASVLDFVYGLGLMGGLLGLTVHRYAQPKTVQATRKEDERSD